MLLSRYGSLEVNDWPFEKALKIIIKAYEKIAEDKLYLRWIPLQHEFSYDSFKQQLINTVIDNSKSEEQILNEVKDILSKVVS